MAINYEKKAEDAMLKYIRSDYHDTKGNLAVFLRQFAAEVIGETEHEFYEMTKGEIMLRRREVISFLVRKKAEIEAGR
jgi:hypothetical protein